MIRYSLLYILCLISTQLISQTWSKTYFTNNNRQENIRCAVQTADGNFVLAGSGFNISQSVVVLFKINKEGDVLWNKSHYLTGHPRASRIVALPDGGFAIAGSGTGGDMLFAIYDENGNEELLKYYKTDFLTSIAGLERQQNGEFLVYGDSDKNPAFNAYDIEHFIMRLDSNGEVIYDESFSYLKTQNEFGLDMLIVNEEYIFTSAVRSYPGLTEDSDILLMKWNFRSGELIWEKDLGKGIITDLELSNDNLSIVAALTTSDDNFRNTAHLAILDFDGQIVKDLSREWNVSCEASNLLALPDDSYIMTAIVYDYALEASLTQLIHFSKHDEELCFTELLVGAQTFPGDLLLTEEEKILSVYTARESFDTHQFPVVSLLDSACDEIETVSSIKDENEEEFVLRISPNPCLNYIDINTKTNIEQLRLHIYDSSGLLVQKAENLKSERIDLSELSTGMYHIVSYQKGSLLSVDKLVKI